MQNWKYQSPNHLKLTSSVLQFFLWNISNIRGYKQRQYRFIDCLHEHVPVFFPFFQVPRNVVLCMRVCRKSWIVWQSGWSKVMEAGGGQFFFYNISSRLFIFFSAGSIFVIFCLGKWKTKNSTKQKCLLIWHFPCAKLQCHASMATWIVSIGYSNTIPRQRNESCI